MFQGEYYRWTDNYNLEYLKIEVSISARNILSFFLDKLLGAKLPTGSFVSWNWGQNQVGVFYVAVNAPRGATSIVFEGSINPRGSIPTFQTGLLEMTPTVTVPYVSVPPYSSTNAGDAPPGITVVEYWNNQV